jgi:hypothetical protein
MQNDPNRDYGLLPLTKDDRDFSHDVVFGSVERAQLTTNDFFVSEPVEIKDQDINYNSDFCAGYAAAAVSEDQEAVALLPEYTFAIAKAIQGDPSSWGVDLRTIAKAACVRADKPCGFLERQYDPFHCNTQERPDRNFIADLKNWPEDLAMLSFEHTKNSFFAVDGPYDTFDNFRSVMIKNKSEQRSILTGVHWRSSWTDSPNGYIDVDTYNPSERGSGHALKIFGQMNAKGKLWLVAQLSNGTKQGDKGIFYFSREVVNKEFVYGAFTFKDMPKEKAATLNDAKIRIDDSLWTKVGKIARYFISWFIGEIFK